MFSYICNTPLLYFLEFVIVVFSIFPTSQRTADGGKSTHPPFIVQPYKHFSFSTIKSLSNKTEKADAKHLRPSFLFVKKIFQIF